MPRYDKLTVKDLNLKDKKVLMRADFNVPLDKDLKITDDKRIKAAVPTIKYLLDQGAAIILLSHLGRPKNGFEDKFSLRPVAERLSELLEIEVKKAEDVIGESAEKMTAELKPGEVLLLENVRFHKEETAGDPAFARKLASFGDLFVNDAFGTAHRAHVTTALLANFLPSAIGFLIEKELEIMAKNLADPVRPFTAVLGGAKVSDKITVVSELLNKVDNLIIGGAMAFTFIAAKGGEVGDSLCERDKFDLALELLKKAEDRGVKVYLPQDVNAGSEFSADCETKIMPADKIENGYMGLDIGPATAEAFAEVIKKSKLTVWNGPMGAFEIDKFADGTRALAKALAESDSISIVGGGDSAAAVEQMGFSDKVTHVSTGGGASLELMEGKTLPGINAVQDRNPRRIFACGNRKMNMQLPGEAAELNQAIKCASQESAAVSGAAVPFTALESCLKDFAFSPVRVLAQNCYHEDSGAYTGEISAKALAYMHLWGVILGHSERRGYFGESDELINKKAKAALSWGLRPVICCGESLEIREEGKHLEFVEAQVRACLAGLTKEQMAFVTLAYEPIWAIGTGKTATPAEAEEVCAHIRKITADIFDQETAEKLVILYGGSMKAGNAAELFACENIDGGLIGGACLKPDQITEIIKLAGEAVEAAKV